MVIPPDRNPNELYAWGMKNLTRREALKLASAGAVATLQSASLGAAEQSSAQSHNPVAVWDVFELTLRAPATGNPFTDVHLSAVFSLGHRTVEVDGFYDGDAESASGGAGIYKVRFMPDTAGVWSYKLSSSLRELDSLEGSFAASPPVAGAHGPVRVRNTHHFAYADGTPFFPFGTTCYAWLHQSEALQQQTLDTLRKSPFNKLRMCVFPKSYEYNHNEPPYYPFERSDAGVSNFTRFNPAFFRHLEQRIADLRAAGIEADLILFHPYDRWGYSTMPAEADDRYLRYVLARLSAYRNIWWSMANEYDLMRAKSTADFDRLFHIVEERDPYLHLRSVHYSVAPYDYAKPWVTHASLQTVDFAAAPRYLAAWKKPVCYDEVMYEGNLNKRWGNLSGDEMCRRFWLGVISGCYVTHGETYLDAAEPLDENSTPTLWWAHGGALHGSSPRQIAFMRELVEGAFALSKEKPMNARTGLVPAANPYYLNATAYEQDGKQASTILFYFDFHQPMWHEFTLPEGSYTAEWIDTLAMTVTAQPGQVSGNTKLRLPGRPYQAVRFRLVRGA